MQDFVEVKIEALLLENNVDRPVNGTVDDESFKREEPEISTGHEYEIQLEISKKSDRFNYEEPETLQTIKTEKEDEKEEVWSKLSKTKSKPPKVKTDPLERCVCPSCGKMVRKTALKAHMEAQHKNLQSVQSYYTCDLCQSRIKQKCNLQSHMKIYHLNQAKPKICKVCGTSFRTNGLLVVHRRKEHTDLYPLLKCPYCGQLSAHTGKHKAHVMRHLGEVAKRHPCRECGRKFMDTAGLKEHMATHTDRRDFICPICGNGFKSPGGLKIHLRGVHAEKNYECPLCSKAFSANQGLRYHVTRHHPNYELPPPGTVVRKNSVRPDVRVIGTALTDFKRL